MEYSGFVCNQIKISNNIKKEGDSKRTNNIKQEGGQKKGGRGRSTSYFLRGLRP